MKTTLIGVIWDLLRTKMAKNWNLKQYLNAKILSNLYLKLVDLLLG